MKPRKKSLPRTKRSADVPVTKVMLYEISQMLKSEITSLRFENSSHTQHFDSLDKKHLSSDARFDSIDKRLVSIDARFDSVDKKFVAIDARFDSVDKKFVAVSEQIASLHSEMNAKFDRMDAKFSELVASVHSLRALCEEQNARNVSVLDIYSAVYHKQNELENQVATIRHKAFGD